jgi:hypothetical protein
MPASPAVPLLSSVFHHCFGKQKIWLLCWHEIRIRCQEVSTVSKPLRSELPNSELGSAKAAGMQLLLCKGSHKAPTLPKGGARHVRPRGHIRCTQIAIVTRVPRGCGNHSTIIEFIAWLIKPQQFWGSVIIKVAPQAPCHTAPGRAQTLLVLLAKQRWLAHVELTAVCQAKSHLR